MTTSLVVEKSHKELPLTLKVYSKRSFYKAQWNMENINARGHVYHEGEPVSSPFPKFFNLGENEFSSRSLVKKSIQEMVSDGLDIFIDKKWNGHLSIVFGFDGKYYNHTKGTFHHVYNARDRKLMRSRGFTDELFSQFPKGTTFMFEVIDSEEPHLMTKTHLAEIGGDGVVLLGINDVYGNAIRVGDYLPILIKNGVTDLRVINEVHSQSILDLCSLMGGMTYDELFDYLLDQKGTEGWILKEPVTGFRIKLKTKWFVKERYKFQFDHERVSKIFIDLFDSPEAYDKIPEELHSRYDKKIEGYENLKKIAQLGGYIEYTREMHTRQVNMGLME